MTTYIYARVSTREQVTDGSSLPVQARECQAWCDTHGLELGKKSNYRNPGVFADPGVSAWKIPLLKRPGFQKLWLELKPGDNLVCMSLDRAFRSVLDFSTMCNVFDSANINPIFIRDQFDMRTPTGKLMAHMCASFAQFKSDLISQRVREAHSNSKRDKARGKAKFFQANNPQLAAALPLANKLIPPSQVVAPCGRVHRYIRVSKSEQFVESQIPIADMTRNRLVAEGYVDIPVAYVDHGVSAFSVEWRDRPAGKLLWSSLQPGDVIVVSRLDRAFRSVQDMAFTTKSLLEQGVHIVTGCGLDTRTPFGRQGIEIMAMMAAWESRDVSWRTRLGWAQAQRLRGKWLRKNMVPRHMKVVEFGDNNSKWTSHPDLDVIEQYREVRRLCESGLPHKQVANIMEEKLAVRHGRPILPDNRFNYAAIHRRFRRDYSEDLVLGYKRWAKLQTPDRNGELTREWTELRVKNARAEFEGIERIMEASA